MEQTKIDKEKEIYKKIESQTEQFVRECQGQTLRTPARYVGSNGIEVYLRYPKDYDYFRSDTFGKDLKDYLVIALVFNLKEKKRGKGWFWRYVEFCRSLVEGGVVIECVHARRLNESLKARAEFIGFGKSHFYIPSNNKVKMIAKKLTS